MRTSEEFLKAMKYNSKKFHGYKTYKKAMGEIRVLKKMGIMRKPCYRISAYDSIGRSFSGGDWIFHKD